MNQRKKRKTIKKINYQMKTKLVILFGIVLLALLGLLVKITYINASRGENYKREVLSQAQQTYQSKTIPAKRGDIYDRNGNILAISNKVYHVILDCQAVNYDKKYIEPTVEALTEVLGLDEDTIRSKLEDEETKESRYQILKKNLSMEEKKAFEKYQNAGEDDGLSKEEAKERDCIVGVWFEEDYLRSYPFESLACDTLGFAESRDTAVLGLEGYYNSVLTGEDGRQYGYISDEADVELTIVESSDGNNIETTLDVGIQQIVEKYVNAFRESMGAKNIGVIIEDPSTGEILAMDGGDRYDLNDPRDLSQMYTEEEIEAMNDAETVSALLGMWSNYCVTDAYEPGSTVKPIVVGAALEKGAISSTDQFLCDGYQNFGVEGSITTIKCAAYPSSHGTETLADVIANSCNDGMMQIAAKMGSEAFIEIQSLFNFGSRTGIDLPNEGYGIIHTSETMGETELACSAFGQGFTCTMIQEINALCSVINGGYYYQPHLVKKITSAGGGTVKTVNPTLMKQTISSNISSDIRSYMQASVEYGTSRYSKVQGYSSGGKTGTAEKFPRGNGKYLVSFIGFAPVNDPQLVIYVVVDEPNAEDQATSTYAQYIAQAILSEVLPYMNISPDEVSNGYVPETELWEGFDGHVQDISGSSVDAYGNLVDASGNLIDMEGNRIDESGYLLDEYGQRRVDENGMYILSDNLELMDDELPEAISNTSAPAPLEEEEREPEDNNMASEGITNEEAGLE